MTIQVEGKRRVGHSSKLYNLDMISAVGNQAVHCDGVNLDITKLDKYANCMEEIKKRSEVIRCFLHGKCNALFLQTTAESICLQVRKVLELIALASLVANKEEYEKTRANFAKDWHAKRIISHLEKINPKFYPVPTKQVVEGDSGKVVRTEEIKSGFLTKIEFQVVYDKCCDHLHADNPFSNSRSVEDFLRNLPSWLEKIRVLLNHHQIQLVEDDQQLWVIMKSQSDGRVQVSQFQRIDTDEIDLSM